MINIEKETIDELKQAEMYLDMIKSQIAVMGRNDTEFESLEHIRQQLLAGIIKPQEAREQADAIFNTKQVH